MSSSSQSCTESGVLTGNACRSSKSPMSLAYKKINSVFTCTGDERARGGGKGLGSGNEYRKHLHTRASVGRTEGEGTKIRRSLHLHQEQGWTGTGTSQHEPVLPHPLVSGRVLPDEVADPRREDLGPLGVGDGLGDLAGTDGAPG